MSSLGDTDGQGRMASIAGGRMEDRHHDYEEDHIEEDNLEVVGTRMEKCMAEVPKY